MMRRYTQSKVRERERERGGKGERQRERAHRREREREKEKERRDRKERVTVNIEESDVYEYSLSCERLTSVKASASDDAGAGISASLRAWQRPTDCRHSVCRSRKRIVLKGLPPDTLSPLSKLIKKRKTRGADLNYLRNVYSSSIYISDLPTASYYSLKVRSSAKIHGCCQQ